jgi:hypothetical protein
MLPHILHWLLYITDTPLRGDNNHKVVVLKHLIFSEEWQLGRYGYRKICDWLKALVAKLFRRSQPDPAPGVLTELDKQLGREIQERQAQASRPREHNMPRYQPCPKGHGMKKIVEKAIVGGIPGALYYCNKCKNEFFVRAR